jgi:Ca-activated chloride channel homolog
MKTTTIFALCAIGLAAALSPTAEAREQAVDCRIELDRAVLPAGGPQTAVLKITLDALNPPRASERPPVNLTIVLDRSGSMSGQKIENAKEAAIAALRRLNGRDLFSLVIYDHEVETIVPAQSAANTEWIEGRIRSIGSRGNTALFAGVSQGSAEVRKNLESEFVHRIILLSDGIANVGPSTPPDLGRLGASLMKEGISVTTIGVGNDYNEDLMTSLSQASDGNAYFVENSDDLPRIFAAELGDVLNVVAKKVIVELSCEDGVKPLRIIGREGRLRNDGIEINLNQLYGGQEKYVLVEIEVPAGQPAEQRRLGEARCRYENALLQREELARAALTASYSASRAEVVQSANVAVQEELIRNVAAEARDQAVVLFDADKREEAIDQMQQTASKLKALGAAYNLPQQALDEVSELEAEAELLEHKGMDRSRRKSLRTDSYQMRNQQMSQ